MHFSKSAATLFSAVMFAVASPVANPAESSDLNPLIDRAETYTPPGWTISVDGTPLPPPDDVNGDLDAIDALATQGQWPTNGRYTGANPSTTGSCGDPDVAAGPFAHDCAEALGLWANRDYLGTELRQIEQSASCVLAWAPSGQEDMTTSFADLEAHFNEILDVCKSDDFGTLIFNYAYKTWDGYGTASIYDSLSPVDGVP